MAKVRVPVANTAGKSVQINSDATAGATIGVDLKLPDGTTPSLTELAAALATEAITAGQIRSFQQLIDSIAPGQVPVGAVTQHEAALTILESQITDGSILAREGDDANFAALTATSYGGITEANLVDKTATEDIAGAWTFSNVLGVVIESADPRLSMRETDAPTDEGNWIFRITGGTLKLQTATDAAPTTGAESFVTLLRTGTVADEFRIKAGIFSVRSGGVLKLHDSTNTDDVSFSHDGIDFNMVGTTTTDWNISGIAKLQAGSMDADFALLTATSYGGITEANLVDKTDDETISGDWEHTGLLITAAGTEGAPSSHFTGDPDTGTYSPAANAWAVTVGGTEAVRYTGASAPLIRYGMTTGVTASTTQTQGQQPLPGSYNEISVCANNNDTVTLPNTASGEMCVVINNGAKRLQVFPASGQDLGLGVNQPDLVKAGASIFFIAFDSTTWFDIATKVEGLLDTDVLGIVANDLLYYDGTNYKHTGGNLTWDASLFDITGDLQVSGDVGFYGTTAVAQQTGVAVTAAGVHAAMVNLGLITA